MKYPIGGLAIPLFLMILAGVCNSVMDTLQFRFSSSIFARAKNQQYWNPQLSWRNRWTNGDAAQGDRFPGSSTCFVAATDAWHLFKFGWLMFVCLAVAHGNLGCAGVIPVDAQRRSRRWTLFAGVFIAMYLCNTVTFELCFRYAWRQ